MAMVEINDLKNLSVRFIKPITVLIGFVGTVSSVGVALAGISAWWLAGIAVVFTFISMCTFYLYVGKSEAFRKAKDRERRLIGIFDRTHTTWHAYKRFNDSLHEGFDIDAAILKVHRDILNMISHLRAALTDLHPGESFRISIKGIAYKNFQTLDKANGRTYINEPFILVDQPLFRDTEEGACNKEDIIHGLDFDATTNSGGIGGLKATLFWECFATKKVVYVDRFNDVQQQYTKKFKSGLVAPVVLHGIPFAFICVGTEHVGVFSPDDVGLVCTFTDALSEYIRFERILDAVQKSRKIVIMKDVDGLLGAIGREMMRLQAVAEPREITEITKEA